MGWATNVSLALDQTESRKHDADDNPSLAEGLENR